MENTNKKNNEQKKTKTKNEALVEIRKKEGITQQQMAEKLHVSARMYRYYEDNELPLPSDLEQFLSEEEVKDIKLSYFSSETNLDAFKIDIRKIISYRKGVLQIQL